MYFFFFNDTATTEIYTLSLHDALPILWGYASPEYGGGESVLTMSAGLVQIDKAPDMKPDRAGRNLKTMLLRSEEHTSELQSRQYLVCRLLLEKKKTNTTTELHNTCPT